MPENRNEPILEARHVTKIFGRQKPLAQKLMAEGVSKEDIFKLSECTAALCDVSFSVKRGEIFVIIGLSGSGKSTMIRCFNRLVKPTDGHVLVEGKTVDRLERKELIEFRRKKISMVFQSFGLFTHRSVLRNVSYGLEIRGVSREEREARAREYIDLVGLNGLEQSAIRELSGGMKQRVGLARALCNNPDVLLMDEPFSALDPLVRSSMQDELLAIQRKLGKTILFITHDINEAFKLGHRVAVMRDGRIIQIGTPHNLLAEPSDSYVKNFIGNSDKSAVLEAGMIMEPAALAANTEEDGFPAKHIKEAREKGIPYIYLVDSRSKLSGVMPARKSEKEAAAGFVTVQSNAAIREILPIAAETPYPLPVVNGGGILLGVISKSALLRAIINTPAASSGYHPRHE